MTMNQGYDQIMAGAEVFGSDNEKIGTVADVGSNYFLVQKGFLFIKDLYLPTRLISRTDENRIYLSVPKHEAESMASEELPATGDAWYGNTATTTTETTRNMNVRDAGTMERDTLMTDTTTRDDNRFARDTARGNENMTVPVVEEQLKAGVREVEGGMARVTKTVREEEQTIDVPVQREEVHVTQRDVNRPATAEELNMMDRDIEIPLREQEVVTQKQAIVTGEVNIRKETITDTQRVTDTVRREEVHVDEGKTTTNRVHMEGLNEVQRTRFARMNSDEQMRYRDMVPADRTRFEADYDRRNPIEKIVDAVEGKDGPRR